MKEFFEKNDKKKLIVIVGFIILVFVVIFAGAMIYNKMFQSVSYDEIKDIMKNATVEYLKDNKDKAPQNINDTVTISERQLVTSGKMEDINTLLKDDEASCEGKVIVTNINGNYRYNPILNCGDKYQSVRFVDYISENVNITESGNGLYQLNNELVYRGDNVDNYLTFSGNTYRIVKFKNDYTVAILTEKLESLEWDDRYNIEKNGTLGINDYTVSRMKDYLDSLFNGETLISSSDKLSVVAHSLPIGKRNSEDTDKSGALENSIVIENQYLSLLPVYDFMNASLDVNCKATTDRSCANYNYLSRYNFPWWTVTGNSVNTALVFKINENVTYSNANSKAYIRPVIYLNSDILYISGNGTKDNPYKIK